MGLVCNRVTMVTEERLKSLLAAQKPISRIIPRFSSSSDHHCEISEFLTIKFQLLLMGT